VGLKTEFIMENDIFFKEYEEHNGFEFSESDKELMVKKEFECFTCGHNFKEDYEDYNVVNDKFADSDEESIICSNCYSDDYLTYCSICENSFENPETPEETVLYVNKYASKEVGLSIGFYQVLKFPYYLSDGFSMSLFDDVVKKISNLDMRKLGYDDSEMSSSKVCYECQQLYKGEKRIVNNYINKKANLHKIIFERGLIKSSLIT